MKSKIPFWRKGDRGASLVESALASLVLMITLFGILEFSVFFRDYLAVRDAADVATAEAASFGSRFDENGNITGDAVVTAAIRNSTGVFPSENIEKIIVWKAGLGSKSSPPIECLNSDVAINNNNTKCNVYGKEALIAIQSGNMDYFLCDQNQDGTPNTSSNVQSCGYPSFMRKDEIGKAEVDYIGVYILARHDFATAFFAGGMNISAYSVRRMEVRRSESQTVIQ